MFANIALGLAGKPLRGHSLVYLFFRKTSLTEHIPHGTHHFITFEVLRALGELVAGRTVFTYDTLLDGPLHFKGIAEEKLIPCEDVFTCRSPTEISIHRPRAKALKKLSRKSERTRH